MMEIKKKVRGEGSKKGAAPPETLAAAIMIFSDGCFLYKPSKSSKEKKNPEDQGETA